MRDAEIGWEGYVLVHETLGASKMLRLVLGQVALSCRNTGNDSRMYERMMKHV